MRMAGSTTIGGLLIKNIHLIWIGFTPFIKDWKKPAWLLFCEDVTNDLRFPIITCALACIWFSTLIFVLQPKTLHKHIITSVEAAVTEQCAYEGVFPRSQRNTTVFYHPVSECNDTTSQSINSLHILHAHLTLVYWVLVCSNSGNSVTVTVINFWGNPFAQDSSPGKLR